MESTTGPTRKRRSFREPSDTTQSSLQGKKGLLHSPRPDNQPLKKKNDDLRWSPTRRHLDECSWWWQSSTGGDVFVSWCRFGGERTRESEVLTETETKSVNLGEVRSDVGFITPQTRMEESNRGSIVALSNNRSSFIGFLFLLLAFWSKKRSTVEAIGRLVDDASWMPGGGSDQFQICSPAFAPVRYRFIPQITSQLRF